VGGEPDDGHDSVSSVPLADRFQAEIPTGRAELVAGSELDPFVAVAKNVNHARILPKDLAPPYFSVVSSIP
jgi:hypothetical protein